jgi:hypothetical protein
LPGIVVRTQRQESTRRRRILVAVAGTTFILGFLVGFVAGTVSSGAPGRAAARKPNVSAEVTAPAKHVVATQSPAPPSPTPSVSPTAPVIAWQPSHQDDTSNTGASGQGGPAYLEYRAMGALAALVTHDSPNFRNVIAWDTSDGLFGANTMPNPTNVKAFKTELDIANKARATYFIGLQTNVADQQKIVVYYEENDDVGAGFAGWLAQKLSALPGFSDSSRLGVRFFSLDPAQNGANYRAIIEFQGPKKVLIRAAQPAGQKPIAKAIAAAVRSFDSQVGARKAAP